MTDQKPREFSLHEEGMWYGAEELPPNHPECKFHVIEHTAYAKALADLEKAKAALRFECGDRCAYQNPCNARACLAELGEG